jgi:hypothetical protein
MIEARVLVRLSVSEVVDTASRPSLRMGDISTETVNNCQMLWITPVLVTNTQGVG